VRETGVLDSASLALPDDRVDRLVLVTCWPLDSLRPNPTQRYVVVAEATPL
jgi:sortase (surface protein transpeptidase)